MSMNIYANEGDKIVFAHPDSGWDYDKETAQTHLTIGDEYTVDCTVVHSSQTDVYIQECMGVKFNSVMFEDAGVKVPEDNELAAGFQSLRKSDIQLFNLLSKNRDRYYAVVDNDGIWVVDQRLEEQEADDAVVGSFFNYGQEFIMSMFEYMNMDAEYC